MQLSRCRPAKHVDTASISLYIHEAVNLQETIIIAPHTHHHLHTFTCSSLNRTPAPTSYFNSQKHQELGRAARRWRLSTRHRLIRARSLSLLSIQQVKSIMDYDLVFKGCYMWLAPKETSSHASTRVRMRGIPSCHLMTLIQDHHLLQTGTVVSVLIRFQQEKLPEMLATARLVKIAVVIKFSK